MGVSGPPDSIHSVAEVVKLTLETMLAYESQYESFQKYNNSRDIFARRSCMVNTSPRRC